MSDVVKVSIAGFLDIISICIAYLFQKMPNNQNQKAEDVNNWDDTGTEKLTNKLHNSTLVPYKLSDAVVCHNGCPAKALA